MMSMMQFVLVCGDFLRSTAVLATARRLSTERSRIRNPKRRIRFATDAVAAVFAVFAAYVSIMPYASNLGFTSDGGRIITIGEVFPLVVTPLALGYFWIIVYSAPRLWRLGHSLMGWGKRLNDA